MKPYKAGSLEPKKETAPLSNLLKLLAILVVVGGVSLGYIYNKYTTSLVTPQSDSSAVVDFSVEEGETVESISARLIEDGLLAQENEKYFEFYLKHTGLGATIQAGAFSIPQNLTLIELAETLQEAGIPDVWVTIPEGLRMDEIAEIISEAYAGYEDAVFSVEEFNSLTSDKEFMANWGLEGLDHLEGYLYPDKYRLPLEATTEYVLTTLVDTFFAKVPAELTYEDLIIASLIEREAMSEDDRYLVADIIRRRLNQGWFLGLDVTFLYYHKDWKRELTYADLQEDQPYNSRTKLGLPPTPICNPGISAIDASLNPKANSYYYFIADSDGNMYYAETEYEHNVNIQNHLQ